MNPSQVPVSPRETVGGLFYLPRLLDKIRRHARGELRADFHANLGLGMDARMCRFLHVDYESLKAVVLAGATDAEALAWCQEHGRPLNDEDAVVWNGFISKRGWRDEATPILEQHKAEAGMADRTDLVTFFDFFDADEGRR
ncbi:MAG: DUF5069 domain-containing protein [Opitutus sp.]|nr:DUF5069 domain-containing protein [Opitutus sp.]